MDADDLLNGLYKPIPKVKEKPKEFVKKPVQKAKKPRKKPEASCIIQGWVTLETKPTDRKLEEETGEKLKWSKVKQRKNKTHCGFCKSVLKAGSWHWMQKLYTEDDVMRPHWWCKDCMDGICVPPK